MEKNPNASLRHFVQELRLVHTRPTHAFPACFLPVLHVQFLPELLIQQSNRVAGLRLLMEFLALMNRSLRTRKALLLAHMVTALLVLGLPFPLAAELDSMTLLRVFNMADEGLPFAQYELGTMYEDGKGVERNLDDAFWWYSLAAEQDYPLAQYKLGTLYHQGKGIEKNYTTAAQWYRKAAEKGVPEAEYNLGVLHYRGQGVPKNHEEAFGWFHKAAEHGLAKAQYQLAVMYANGQGVPADFDKSIGWLKKSAEQGYSNAELALQRMGIPLKEPPAPLESAEPGKTP